MQEKQEETKYETNYFKKSLGLYQDDDRTGATEMAWAFVENGKDRQMDKVFKSTEIRSTLRGKI